jgi:hypothetical protein
MYGPISRPDVLDLMYGPGTWTRCMGPDVSDQGLDVWYSTLVPAIPPPWTCGMTQPKINGVGPGTWTRCMGPDVSDQGLDVWYSTLVPAIPPPGPAE